MAEVFGVTGDPVQVAGEYGCSLCGHRQHLGADDRFPPDHHAEHPWTLMIADDTADLSHNA